MKTMHDLKTLAAGMGCTVTEHVDHSRSILIDAPDGFGWDGGTLLQLVEVYHEPHVDRADLRTRRAQAIHDAAIRLEQMGAPADPAQDE